MDKNILTFLSELSENNHKEWFESNRKRYDKVKSDVIDLAAGLIPRLAEFDPSIGLLDPRKCIFRINRDVRFSKDKSPYKTNMGIFFSRNGKSDLASAGYYLHFEPGKCFIGGGIYGPPPDVLKAIRQEIYFHPQEFRQIVDEKRFKEVFGGLGGEKLVRSPKGFPDDFREIDLLKYKHYIVGHNVDDNLLDDPGFENHIMQIFNTMKDFNGFLNRAIHMAG
jgi:uncharacterized protein (TIGR02453 family)